MTERGAETLYPNGTYPYEFIPRTFCVTTPSAKAKRDPSTEKPSPLHYVLGTWHGLFTPTRPLTKSGLRAVRRCWSKARRGMALRSSNSSISRF